MSRNTIVIIGLVILAIIALVVMFFSFRDTSGDNVSSSLTENGESENQEEKTSEVEMGFDQENFIGGAQVSMSVYSYGGEKDIKTLEEGGAEYALIRNPSSIGGLDLAIVNPFGNYYFAENNGGERIIFSEGDPEGRHGYNEIGLVSGKLIRERRPYVEYFSAYPDSLSAQVAGLISVPDTGVSNRFLQSRYLLIKNLNNNVSVISEIDHRGSEKGTLLVSDATRIALGLDNGSVGNLQIELISSENTTLGVVRF